MTILQTESSMNFGGQEMHTINLSLALLKKARFIIACNEGSAISQKAKQAGLEVVHFNLKFSYNLLTVFKLVKFIKQNNIDIVSTHSGHDTWLGMMAAKICKIKFIRHREIGLKLKSSRLNFVHALADYTITAGEQIRQMMIQNNRVHPDKIASIPAGIDDTKFNPVLYDKQKCLDQFKLDKNKIYITMIAFLKGGKRHDMLLNIALSLHDEFKNAVYLIAGEGEKRADIENFINQNNMQSYVKMLGHVTDTPQLLMATDIFMLLSDNEGVPQVIPEALLMQKPCIATDVGSIKDLYHDGNFILTKLDEDEVKMALRELICSEEKRQSMQTKARKYILENFTKDKETKRVYEIYEMLTKTHKD